MHERESLYDTCVRLLKAAHPDGRVCRKVALEGVPYNGFDLVLEEPDRIFMVAFCLNYDGLRRTREDLLAFHSALPFSKVYKKLHLVVIHEESLRTLDEPWPSGISLSPISLPEDMDPSNPAPPGTVQKLEHILGLSVPHTQSAERGQGDWRLFLTVDQWLEHARKAARADGPLPEEIRELAAQLLGLAHDLSGSMEKQVTGLLDKRWEERQ